MPLMLSSCVVNRKQLDIWGFGVPELNKVGVAWVNQPSLSPLYVSTTASRSSLWMPMATRMSMC